jgi:hypothetical protein
VAAAPAAVGSPVAHHVKGTLRREVVDGKPTLFADAVFEKPGFRGLESGVERSGGAVRKVPVLREEEVEAPTRSGRMAKTRTGQVSLAAELQVARHATGREVPAAWRAFSEAAKAPVPGAARPPRSVLRISEWTLRAVPSYVPVRWGRPSPEDEDPRAEELNSVLAKRDPAELRRVFGQANGYVRVDWQFEAKEVGTGRTLRVVTSGAAGPGEVEVRLGEEGPANPVATVRFPAHADESLYELRAVATSRDTLGSEATAELVVWDGLLPVARDEVDGLVATAGALAGVGIEPRSGAAAADAFEAARRKGRQPSSFAAHETASRSLHLFAAQAAADGEINVAELASLVSAAKVAAVP